MSSLMTRGSFARLGSGADVECGRKQVRRQVQWFAGTSCVCWEGAKSHAELTKKMSSDGRWITREQKFRH
jgi:hypothetical protein